MLKSRAYNNSIRDISGHEIYYNILLSYFITCILISIIVTIEYFWLNMRKLLKSIVSSLAYIPYFQFLSCYTFWLVIHQIMNTFQNYILDKWMWLYTKATATTVTVPKLSHTHRIHCTHVANNTRKNNIENLIICCFYYKSILDCNM